MSVIENITEWLLKQSRINTLEIGSSILRWAGGGLRHESSLAFYRSCLNPGVKLSVLQDGEVFETTKLATALKSLAKIEYGIHQYAAVILPDQAFHLGSLTVPAAVGKAGIQPLIERDIQKNAALPFSSYIIKHEQGKNQSGKLLIQYCALPKQIVENLNDAFAEAGIIPVSIQPSFICLYRFLASHQAAGEHPSIFLHIGNKITSLGIFEKAGLRTIAPLDFGVQTLISAIMQANSCDVASASQQLFKEPLLLDDPATPAQREISAFAAIEDVMADFLQKVYGQLLLFTSENPQETGFARILISGGGALIKNFDKLIGYNLGISAGTISKEFKDIQQASELPDGESLEILAPMLGNLSLKPVIRDRFERVMAA